MRMRTPRGGAALNARPSAPAWRPPGLRRSAPLHRGDPPPDLQRPEADSCAALDYRSRPLTVTSPTPLTRNGAAPHHRNALSQGEQRVIATWCCCCAAARSPSTPRRPPADPARRRVRRRRTHPRPPAGHARRTRPRLHAHPERVWGCFRTSPSSTSTNACAPGGTRDRHLALHRTANGAASMECDKDRFLPAVVGRGRKIVESGSRAFPAHCPGSRARGRGTMGNSPAMS